MNDDLKLGAPSSESPELDALLKRAFPDSPELSPAFEDRVMQVVRTRRPARWSTLGLFIIMSFYWAATLTVSAWLVVGQDWSAGFSPLLLAVLLPTLIGCIAMVGWLLRHGPLRLSELVLRTVQP